MKTKTIITVIFVIMNSVFKQSCSYSSKQAINYVEIRYYISLIIVIYCKQIIDIKIISFFFSNK